ncbi:MAG: RES family NAD+ phosphorylase [Gammaproteobacteria bacterium]|nr:RES family NAD+ phosphorylase [Gammaproteobacteria bacterium]MCP5198410.1 RES family NAD+ phosphorylase [Gammaproteobacteria bacterium]
MPLVVERLADGHTWWRIADRSWDDPLDPGHANRRGGRWNAPGDGPTLYLNADLVTARLNLRTFIAGWPYEPEDLRDDNGPLLIGATLPRRQRVCDAHSALGVVRAGLPPNYPRDENGAPVGHARCQPIGSRARAAGLRGVHARSAPSPDGAGRELAWFPAGPRARARRVETLSFVAWFWG